MEQAIGIAERIAEGHLDNRIRGEGRDETSQLLTALNRMQSNLKQRTDAERRTAAEVSRIKSALDKASTNMMVADNNGIIIYMNESIIRTSRSPR